MQAEKGSSKAQEPKRRRILALDINRGGSLGSLIRRAGSSVERSEKIEAMEREVFAPIQDVIDEATARAIKMHEAEQKKKEDQDYLHAWIALGQTITDPFRQFPSEAEELFHGRKGVKIGGPLSKTYETKTFTSDEDGQPLHPIAYHYHLDGKKVVLDWYEEEIGGSRGKEVVRVNYKEGEVQSVVLLFSSRTNGETTYAKRNDLGENLSTLFKCWQPYFENVIQGGVVGLGFIVENNKPPVFGAFSGESFANPFQQQSLYSLDPSQRMFTFSKDIISLPVSDSYWLKNSRDLMREYYEMERSRRDESEEFERLKKKAETRLGSASHIDSIQWHMRHHLSYDDVKDYFQYTQVSSRPPQRSFSLDGKVAAEVLGRIAEYVTI
jgi:hypothetical protein